MAVGYAKVPHYRGASTHRNIMLPLPLAIYRGEKYSLDEEGAHRWLFTSDRVKLDLSLAAGLPVPRDSQSKAREGMPGLDGTIELGPRLEINLLKKRRHALSLNFPLRFNTSVSLNAVAYHGWLFAPYLQYFYKNPRKNGWEFDLSLGPQYASQKYHSYYYEVAPKYETVDRPVYEVDAGYSGSRVTLYVQKTIERLWLSAFARYDVLDDAVFRDSPLLEKKNYLVAGFVVGWIFMKSPQKVIVRERDTF